MKLWLILLALLCSLPCGAVNLVRNPGFEESGATLSQWTVTPAASDSYIVVGTALPHSGIRSASFGAYDGLDDVISQTIATTAGETYTFSFWVQTDSAASNHLAVSFNSLTLLNLTNFPTPGGLYRQYEFSVLGTGTDTISFAGQASAGFVRLDDVYFGVPELAPACAQLPLLIAGLLLTASRRRRGALVL